MKILQNKFFISFLILAVVFISSARVTQAGPVVGFFIGWAVNIAVGVNLIGDIIFLAFFFCVAGGPIGDCGGGEDGGTIGGPIATEITLGSYGCLYGVPITLSSDTYCLAPNYCYPFGQWDVYRNGVFIDSFTGTEYVDRTAPPDSDLNYELKTTIYESLYCCNPGKTDCNGWCPQGSREYSITTSVTTPSCPDTNGDGPMATIFINKAGCDYIELSVIPTQDSEADNYDVYRNGSLIASSIPISQSTYRDSGLSVGITYTYTVTVKTNTDPIRYQEFGPIDAALECLPSCSFNAVPENLIYPNTDSELSWSCQNAVSCSISEGIGDVNPVSGSVPVKVDKTTMFVLTCENADGDKNFSITTVNVSRGTIIEVPPR